MLIFFLVLKLLKCFFMIGMFFRIFWRSEFSIIISSSMLILIKNLLFFKLVWRKIFYRWGISIGGSTIFLIIIILIHIIFFLGWRIWKRFVGPLLWTSLSIRLLVNLLIVFVIPFVVILRLLAHINSFYIVIIPKI